jgi:hypothetical protein
MQALRYAVLAATAAVAAAVATPAFAQEMFTVVGSNPGSDKVDYKGEVAVTKTGATWQIEWRVGGPPVKGTGVIMDGTHMAASGIYDGKAFVFIMKKDGARFVGIWTTQGSNEFGKEVWAPK